ncbi:MAG: helix-turn-helix domain-containing protein [Fusobacteriaceae bacterium]
MDDYNNYEVSKKIREDLGNYIKECREKSNLGLNQFCLKTGIQPSLFSRLENGKLLKINPFLLQKISSGLKIDYKDLYKRIGYLDEKDFSELDDYKQRCEELEKKIKKLEDRSFFSSENQDKKNEINLSGLSPERIEELKRYAEFLKTQ